MRDFEQELKELAGEIRAETSDVMGRVARASGVAGLLGQVGDRLVDQFVEAGREAGHSWAEIGDALGVSRQAVHQRFGEPGRFLQAPLGKDGIREKAAPFAAMRQASGGSIEVRADHDDDWHVLVSLCNRPVEEWVDASRAADSRRWFKRLSEDIDVVAAGMGTELGAKVEVVTTDPEGKTVKRVVPVTVAKRKSACSFNRPARLSGSPTP